MAAGAYHSLAVIQNSKRGSSRLFCWGEGRDGRLGTGDDRSRSAPAECSLHRYQPRRFLPPEPDLSSGGGLLKSMKSFRGGGAVLSEADGAVNLSTLHLPLSPYPALPPPTVVSQALHGADTYTVCINYLILHSALTCL